MTLIPLIIYAAELALAAIILFYVVEMLAMPGNMKRVCQGLIVLIAILSVSGGARLRSSAGRAHRTDIAEFSEQSQHHPVKANLCRLRRPTGAWPHEHAAPTACERVRVASDRPTNRCIARKSTRWARTNSVVGSPCRSRRNMSNFSTSIVLCVRHPILINGQAVSCP